MNRNDEFSDYYWENCTKENYAPKIVQWIWVRLERYGLDSLVWKFNDRSLRILEVGSWNWELLNAFLSAWFHDVRWLDMNPRHMRKYPELSSIVDINAIQMKSREPDEKLFDVVYTNLVFDEDYYREQQNDWFRSNMLQWIHSHLQPDGLYYWEEYHQLSEIMKEIDLIRPRANSLVWIFDKIIIPSKM